MRFFIEGLQGDLQAYVSLGRPTNFQEAESLARMKDIVYKRQGVSETKTIISEMKTLFSDLMEKQANSNKVIAAAAPSPGPSASDKKIDEVSKKNEPNAQTTAATTTIKCQLRYGRLRETLSILLK